MGRSQETFSKKENEKKRQAKRKEKEEKREERKANAKKGASLEEMYAYVDENGNLTSTPPDPKNKKVINTEEILLGARPIEASAPDALRKGVVTHFNESKGYGFIRDLQSGESIFVHINQLAGPLKENDKVTFGVEMGHKGPNAVRVAKGG